jgi:sulfopyruvate decarboxylase alpha subunit
VPLLIASPFAVTTAVAAIVGLTPAGAVTLNPVAESRSPESGPEMWPDEIHRELIAAQVRIVGYVPDAGHKRLIELCLADKSMRAVVLSTEEEGIGLAAGAWLGGERSVLLMQSSGVGNIINALGAIKECRFPFVTIVTMRGEEGEFNPWQVPMGQATRMVLEAMGTVVHRPAEAEEIAPMVNAAFRLAYNSYASVAVLIPQRIVGIKSFQEQAGQ